MNIKEGLIITLENDKEYYVSSLILDEGYTYLYLISIDAENDNDLRFVRYENDKVYDIVDNALIEKLLRIVEERTRAKE